MIGELIYWISQLYKQPPPPPLISDPENRHVGGGICYEKDGIYVRFHLECTSDLSKKVTFDLFFYNLRRTLFKKLEVTNKN